MAVFDDIRLRWKGQDYVVRANRVMGALARIEDVITFGALYSHMQRGDVPLVKLSQAYGAVLRYAGARIEDEEIYAGMFDEASRDAVMAALQALMEMMLPPAARKTAATADAGQESPPANPPATAS